MFSAIYIEEEVRDNPLVTQLCDRFAYLPQISCERYGEVFNRKGQNFRLQKKKPALILARKHGSLVLPAPAGYGYDASPSYYFSHMLNCVYDCRYCFLQGMYESANYVLFVNYEDFAREIDQTVHQHGGKAVFYSGYDCDSLALDPVSGFADYFLPRFRDWPDAQIEIRSKSTQIRSLLAQQAMANCVVAMSFTSTQDSQRWEHKVPSVSKRIEALEKLQERGWPIALRFEPLIRQQSSLADYSKLFEQVFNRLNSDRIHSVSTGLFRMPKPFYKRIEKLYPDEPLFLRPSQNTAGMISLIEPREAGDAASSQEGPEAERDFVAALESELLQYVEASKLYRCG